MEEDTSQTKSNPDLNNHGAQSSSSSRCPPHHLSLDGPGGGGCLASTSDEKKKQEAEGRLGVCNGEVDSLLSIDETDSLPKKLNYTCFDLFCTLVSILTYVADLVMDIVVAVYFYHLGVNHGIYHYWYFGLTVTFILLPSLTMTGFSFRWYLQDADDAQLPPVPLWRWILRLIVLMLQIAPVLRYIDSIRYGLMSRYVAHEAKKNPDPEKQREQIKTSIKYYTLMVYEESDAALLRLFECFMESAPQLVLQIYILLKDPHAIQLNERRIVEDEWVDPILKTTILCASVLASLISLAWALVVYHRSLRYADPVKNNINLAGSLFQFLWHFFSITARVLALSLFASIYPRVIGPVCIAHWLIMATWVMCQKTQACNSACEEFLFNIVLGAVYIFSFFNAKEGRTRYKYALYYSFCFVENTVLIVFWFLYANSGLLPGQTHWYWIPGIIGHYVMFFGGILFMVIYYTCFHPTGIDLPRILKVRGRQNVAHSRSSPRAERPTFLDLREMPGKGKGDEDLSSASLAAGGCNLRPGSRTSQSTPTLDEIDSGARIVARGGGEEDGRAGHNSVRKTSSAPTGDLRSAMSAVRSLKYMRNDRTKC